MSNLNNNTTQLEALLVKVNALPAVGSTDDLNATITELEAKVSTLNTALDGKAAGGGGSVETCTITVGVTGGSVYCAYTKCENGVITYETIVPSLTLGTVGSAYCEYFVLTNVVCNSTVFVQQDDSGTSEQFNNTELLQKWNNGRYFVFRPLTDGYITMND